MDHNNNLEELANNTSKSAATSTGSSTFFSSVVIFIFGLGLGLFSGYSFANSLTITRPDLPELNQENQTQDPEGLPISLQFALERDAQRLADLSKIAEAVEGVFIDTNGLIPTEITSEKKRIGTGTGDQEASLSAVLTPDYLETIPFDPANGTPDYTGYEIYMPSETTLVLEAQSEANPGKSIFVVKELDLQALMR